MNPTGEEWMCFNARNLGHYKHFLKLVINITSICFVLRIKTTALQVCSDKDKKDIIG